MSRRPPTPKRKPKPATPAELRDAIRDEALRLGFDAVGFAPANAGPGARDQRLQRLIESLDAGWQGDMGWLGERTEQRADPQNLWQDARTVVSLAINYAPPTDPLEILRLNERAAISVYAQGRDYHRVIKKRLHDLSDRLRAEHRGAGFRSFVDTAPVLEREHAARAGLGWIGKHTLLIHPRIGSYFLLGGIYTTLDLTPPPEQTPVADACGTCARCIDACPTGAITPYSVDGSRCISYLTIEHRSAIPEPFHRAMGGWVFGCDICQEVCPHNSPRERPVARVNPAYEPRNASFDLLEVLGWDESRRRDAFATSALKRVALDTFRPNAVIALGNALERRDDPVIRRALERIAADASEGDLVRDAAASVLARFAPRP